jgi:hypothetical protein
MQNDHIHEFDYIYIFKGALHSWESRKPKQCIGKICDCGKVIYYKQKHRLNYTISIKPKADEQLE